MFGRELAHRGEPLRPKCFGSLGALDGILYFPPFGREPEPVAVCCGADLRLSLLRYFMTWLRWKMRRGTPYATDKRWIERHGRHA